MSALCLNRTQRRVLEASIEAVCTTKKENGAGDFNSYEVLAVMSLVKPQD